MLVFSVAMASAPVGAIEADRHRIERHLERVAQQLAQTEPVDLSPEQHQRRLESLEVLEAYRRAGEFPHNTERPGERVPVFRDREGRDCAVGALIRASGEGALADTVNARWHLDRVPEMQEPALLVWAQEHGFTEQELAEIQPSYCMCEEDEAFAPVCAADGVTYWNACVAEVCAGQAPVSDGPCPYEREVCPDFVASEPPVVGGCTYSDFLCIDEPFASVWEWTFWLAEQDALCLVDSGDPFDGPDAPAPEEPAPGGGCSTGPGPGSPRWGWLGLLLVARRIFSGSH
jgi:MYXO-CTERM domain-containing protein